MPELSPPDPPTKPVPRPGGCLVLVEAGRPAPVELLNALGSRGLSARVAHDEPGVMLGLSQPMDGQRVLVVVEPGDWPRYTELVKAVRAHHRDVLCWQFCEQPGRRPKLSAVNGSVPGRGADGPGPDDDEASSAQERADRLAGRRVGVSSLLNKVPGRPLSTREVVTQQELTMLLGPMPGEAV